MHVHHARPTRPGVLTGLALTLLAAACGLPGAAQPSTPPPPATPEVTATDLPGLSLPADNAAVDINNQGQVVGVRYVDDEARISVWEDGQVTDIGPYRTRPCYPPNATFPCGTPSVQINERGHVGTEIDGHAVLWQDGALVDIDGDAAWSRLLGLNDRGQALIQRATGEQTDLSLWSRGQLRQIAAPPAGSPVWNLNGRLSSRGHVVVSQGVPSAGGTGGCPATSYLWHRGQRREIGFLSPTEVNGRGQVIGTACEVVDGTNRFYEAVWEDGAIRRLPGLDGLADLVGANPIQVRDLNDRGQILGYNVLPGPRPGTVRQHTVLWEDGTVTDIGTGIGGVNSPVALNERGQVLMNGTPDVGGLPTGNSFPSGFLWDEGSLVNLAPVDNPAVIIRVHAMNDRGQIVGHHSVIPGSSGALLWEVR